jgi:hypothetical protein
MNRRLVLIAVAATLIGTAGARTLEIVEGAYETVLADVTFPGSIAGTLILKMCDTCDAKALAVDSGTVYVGPDGQRKPLAEFLDDVARLRAAPGGEQSSAVGVFYSLETDRVTRVRLHADALN